MQHKGLAVRYPESLMTMTVRASLIALMMEIPAAALAQTLPPSGSELRGLIACREKTDTAERLACFDKQVAAVDQALQHHDLVVVNTQEIDRSRRQGFGLASSDRVILSRVAGRSAPLPLNHDGVIRSVSAFSYGRYTMTLADGAVWRNVDLFETAPAVGSTVHIDKTPFGAYLMKVTGFIGVHAVRVH